MLSIFDVIVLLRVSISLWSENFPTLIRGMWIATDTATRTRTPG